MELSSPCCGLCICPCWYSCQSITLFIKVPENGSPACRLPCWVLPLAGVILETAQDVFCLSVQGVIKASSSVRADHWRVGLETSCRLSSLKSWCCWWNSCTNSMSSMPMVLARSEDPGFVYLKDESAHLMSFSSALFLPVATELCIWCWTKSCYLQCLKSVLCIDRDLVS